MDTAIRIRELQRQAASCTDELVSISEEIGEYIVAAHGTVPQEMSDLQCRIQRERCRRLAKKLRTILAELAGCRPGESADSLEVTRQMIAWNLLILEQKENFLTEFLGHSVSIGARLRDAREMSDLAGVIRLQNTLRGELGICRTEKEK